MPTLQVNDSRAYIWHAWILMLEELYQMYCMLIENSHWWWGNSYDYTLDKKINIRISRWGCRLGDMWFL